MDQRLRYLETRVNSASPGELLVMLYDGLIHHAENASNLLSEPQTPENRNQASTAVSRCIDILTELNTSLKHDIDPALCTSLRDLYLFYMREFSEALEKSEPRRIDTIVPLISTLRNAWQEAERITAQPQVHVA